MKITPFISVVALLCFSACISKAQKEFKIVYGDPLFMKLSNNKIVFDFLDGLDNGIWLAFFDSAMNDTAMQVTIANRQLTGPYKRWDITDKYIYESGNLRYGKRDGNIYFRLLNDDGKMYINIEKWDTGKFDGYIQQEW